VRLGAAVLIAGLAVASAAGAHEPAPLPALDFEPPAPGTYTLHRIMAAPEGEVLDVEGRAQPLSRVLRGRLTLLGFIYTTCVDPDGCPLAYRVFEALRHSVASRSLSEQVQLVTLSFDPLRDTPAAMQRYGSRVDRKPGSPPWYFLTTRSPRALAPLVEGFGQDVRETRGRRRELSHVLKVFLIDPAGFVREIYTSAFLHPRTVMNDIETLLRER
jgi:cytochrome oxidase Cu insertion factor (SCO1/SenC/PrrC family)